MDLFIVWLIILAIGIVFALVLRDRPDWLFSLLLCVAVVAVPIAFFSGISYFRVLTKIDWGSNQVVSIVGFMVGFVSLGGAWYVKTELIDKNKKDK